MRFVVTGLAILALAASAGAQTIRKVPQDYDTIQAACDAEETVDGDTILVSKKADGSPYEEWVTTGKRLNFVGKGVTWDGHKLSGGESFCLGIEAGSAGGLVVQGFHFRNGDGHLSIAAHDVVVQGCTFRTAYGDAVYISGNGATVQKCTFRGNGGEAVNIEGSGALVQKNTATSQGSGGLYVYGAGARVLKNKVVRSGENYAVHVQGDDAVVSGNTLSDGYTGIHVVGEDGLIEKNKVARYRGESSGIDAYGRGHRVVANTVSMIDGDGIYMNAEEGSSEDGLVVEGNKVRWAHGSGIYASGYTAEVRGNAVQHVGSLGIYCAHTVADSASVVEGNRVLDCFSTGIYVNGGGHDVLGNDVKSVAGHGIYCSGNGYAAANSVRDNRVAGFFITGIRMDAQDAAFELEGNAVSDGMSWSEGINVNAPGATAGSVRGNRVSGAGGTGIQVYAAASSPGLEVTDNAVDGSGTSWDYGFDISFTGGTVAGNTVSGQVDAGIYVNGAGNSVDGNLVRGCLRMCLGVQGADIEVTGNGGIGSDGEGFANWGTNTIFTGNTFLKNRLDVTNNGTFATADIAAVNVFVTGGAGTLVQVWD